jgi:hypothetical protein
VKCIVTELAVFFTPELLATWQAEAEAALTKFARPLGDGEKAIQLSEQFLVLITCRKTASRAAGPVSRGGVGV